MSHTTFRESLYSRAALIALLIAITANALANILPFNGMTTGAISDLYPLYLTPLGYVFSIWSVIYFGLLAFSAYSLEEKGKHMHPGIQILFLASSIANGAWIIAWHAHALMLSVVFMLILLFALIRINESLHMQRVEHIKEYWFVHAPFHIYLAWICVATILNVGALLLDAQWNGFGFSAEFWSLVMLGVAAGATTAAVHAYRSIPFALVIIWAMVGIAAKTSIPSLVALAAICVALWHAILIFWLTQRYTAAELFHLKKSTR